jgi:hypothetical protein
MSDRDQISSLLAADWKVVSYSSHNDMGEDDNVEWIVHKILLEKDNSLSCYEVHFEGDEFSTVKEVIIAPGKYK